MLEFVENFAISFFFFCVVVFFLLFLVDGSKFDLMGS